MAPESRKPNRRFRFSLRGLLCFTVLAAAAFAWINYEVGQARERRIAVEGLLAGGGGVSYADATGETYRGVAKAGDPFPGNWLTRLLGENPQLEIKSAVVGDVQQSRRGLRQFDVDGDHNLQFVPRLQGIEYLDARGQSVTDQGLQHLRNVPTLKTLNLSGASVTDQGLSHLTGLTQLRLLILEDTGVTDIGMAHVAKLANLRTLNLTGTKISAAAIKDISSLSGLRRLILADVELGDPPLNELAALRLRRLSLRNTGVNDAWLAVLARMDSLVEVDLYGAKISAAGLQRLSSLPNLETVIIGPETARSVASAGLVEFKRSRPDVNLVE